MESQREREVMDSSWQFRLHPNQEWHDCSREDAAMAQSNGYQVRLKPEKEEPPHTQPPIGNQDFQKEYQINLDWLDSQK